MGITVVGILLSSAVPMGIILGPLMCGIYLCLLRRLRGEAVAFDMLFKGFDYFAQSLIATLIQTVPMILLVVPIYLGFFILFMSKMSAAGGRGQGAVTAPSDVAEIFVLMGIMIFVVILMAIAVSAVFIFTYPLIVDLKLSAIDAIRASVKAVFANLGGILGLLALNTLLMLAGLLLCYVGALLVMPISFAALTIAYRQVFPAETYPKYEGR